MDITTRAALAGIVLDVDGRLIAGGPEFAFSTAVRRVIDDRPAALVVNLASVSMVDAAGVGAIIAAAVTARDRGVSFAIADPGTRVRTMLSITGVSRLVDVVRLRDWCRGSSVQLTPCAAPRT